MIENLSPEFQQDMRDLLQDQAAAFWKTLEGPPKSGLRINTLKANDPLPALSGIPGRFQPLPWTEAGFQIISAADLGRFSLHLAGVYYLQEPSAMVPVEVLDPQPGEWILDLCAAPGGKTTQIASRLAGRGWLLANDPNPRRIQALTRNVERWGARNVGITCETPSRLAERLGAVFDRVLVDAPCSGEGTFRTDPGAARKWSPAFRERCARIQDDIIWQGSKLVRPGGLLVYSTCTFNQLENEGTLERFLDKNPDFRLESVAGVDGYSPGIPPSGQDRHGLKQAVRIWPHLAPGEGHFAARIRKSSGYGEPLQVTPGSGIPLDGASRSAYLEFFQAALRESDRTGIIHPGSPDLRVFGNQLYLLAAQAPGLEGLNVKHWGWWIGTLRGEEFIPSPALAAGLTAEDFQLVLEFAVGSSELEAYQRGSPVRMPAELESSSAWVLITVRGYTLGWGKIRQGSLKSQLPNWLRGQ